MDVRCQSSKQVMMTCGYGSLTVAKFTKRILFVDAIYFVDANYCQAKREWHPLPPELFSKFIHGKH